MRFAGRFVIVSLLLCFVCALGWAQEDRYGVLVNQPEAFDGYTFIAPRTNSEAYVIDNEGRIVQTWDFGGRTREIHLLETGNILVVRAPQAELDKSLIELGYNGDGELAEFTWEGDLVWQHTFSDPARRHHHGIDILPNGNILALVWDYHQLDEAIAKGLHPDIVAASFEDLDSFLPDTVLEIDRESGEIVWQWEAWNHLIQNTDATLPNFGDPAANPQRIDINYEQYYLKGIPVGWSAGPADWMHSNMVNYNPLLDQIVISVLRFDEFWIFSHSHSSEATRGTAGDLLYRWGNPFAYGQGDMTADRKLYLQHDVQWIDEGLPGAGNILLFNNRVNVVREDRVGEDEHSSVLEIKLPLLPDGSYNWSSDGEVVWQYDQGFYSRIISGVQRLPNGNTLITEGVPGRLIEVTQEGEVVWEFVLSIEADNNWIFRSRKYPADHPGFAGKELRPGRVLGEA